jgi:hypothetical protein
VDVTFAYYGHKTFSMLEFKEVSVTEDIPPFHSRIIFPSETTWFDITLTDTMINKTKLVEYYIPQLQNSHIYT